MHVLTVNEDLLDTAKARAIAEREMAVSAEQLFATLEDGPSWTKVDGGRSARSFGRAQSRSQKERRAL